MYEIITWFIIGFMVGVYRKEIYKTMITEYKRNTEKKEV